MTGTRRLRCRTVAQLSGGAGGPDVFETARKGLGLDSLDVSTGSGGGPALGASRYLGDRLSVGARAGAQPKDTAVGVDVTRRIKLKGEAGSDGRTSVGAGAGAEWEW